MADQEINTPPSSLPPYTEMIFAAIDALKEKEDATEQSISNYIQSTCGSLPDDHTKILADQLNKLVEKGELLLSSNNYSRLDTNIPAKRGRGRPPKAKDTPLSDGGSTADADAPVPVDGEPAPGSAQPGSEVKRGRGRPRKDPNAPPSVKKVKVASSLPTPPSKTGRPRGRPRKVQPEATGVEAN